MVLNIVAILGTSPIGLPIDTALSRSKFNLDLKNVFEERAVEALTKKDQMSSKEDVRKLQKIFFHCNTLITHFADSEGEDLKKIEHEAFLFYS